MIKLKKIVAVAMATTMIMGLSMTASAMNISSPYYNDPSRNELAGDPVVEDDYGNTVDVSFDTLTSKSEAAESVNTAKKLANVLEENDASVPKGAKVVPIFAANLNDVPEEGATITFALTNFDATGDDYTQYRQGDTVYALMETAQGTGVWELAEGTVNDKGEVEFTIDHNGAFVLFKTIDEKTGKMVKLTYSAPGVLDPDNPPVIVDPDQPDQPTVPTPDEPGTSTDPSNGQNANGAANANGGSWTTSPKTGEF